MFRSFCRWSKLARIFHRTDRTETLPPYPILICTIFGISAENVMLLSRNARFLQFQQLMECATVRLLTPKKKTVTKRPATSLPYRDIWLPRIVFTFLFYFYLCLVIRLYLNFYFLKSFFFDFYLLLKYFLTFLWLLLWVFVV